MKNNKKNKTIIFIILSIILVILFSSIVYSAFSSTMHITGNAHARVEANVRITDFRLKSVTDATSSYEDFGKSHISTNVNLTNSSSTITYYLEITNYGSVDVGILNITGLPTGVNYSIKDYNLTEKICNDDGKCNNFINKTYELTLTTTSSYSGNIQMNFDFRTYHKITYTNITNNGYPTEVIDGGSLVINFKETLNNISFLSNGVEFAKYEIISANETLTIKNISSEIEVLKPNTIVKIVSGDLKTPGSEICIQEECFYLVESDTTTATLLSKYNLYVGGQYNSTNGTYIEYGDIATGIQNKNMLAYVENIALRKGTIAYSSTSSNYTGSIAETYVKSYVNYLKSLGATVVQSGLITKTQLEKLGCSGTSCTAAPSWVYSTSYWTGSSYDVSKVYYVVTNGFFSNTTYTNDYGYGIRPLIRIALSDVNQYQSNIKVVSGNLDTIGSEACIENECFYVLSSTSNTVTMLSKYNLYVGGMYNNGTYTSYGAGVTGIQNPSMLGYVAGTNNRMGVIQFSDTYYWRTSNGELSPNYGTSYPAYVFDENAAFYTEIENYKSHLITLGTSVIDIRLISLEELKDLGCDETYNSCSNAPEWISSTSYWTGTAKNSASIWNVTAKSLTFNAYNTNSTFGVRPVITIPKVV